MTRKTIRNYTLASVLMQLDNEQRGLIMDAINSYGDAGLAAYAESLPYFKLDYAVRCLRSAARATRDCNMISVAQKGRRAANLANRLEEQK